MIFRIFELIIYMLYSFSFDLKDEKKIDILILYYNFGQYILKEMYDFNVILNLDFQTGSDFFSDPQP